MDMFPESLKNFSNVVLIVGLGLAALGTFGINHFRSVIETRREKHQAEKDAQQAAREASLNEKLEQLIQGNVTLQDQLAPFERIARERYPSSSTEEALGRLSSEMNDLRHRASALENRTKTPTLTVRPGAVTKTEQGFALEFVLHPSNAIPLGEVILQVRVQSPKSAKILSLSPVGMNYMIKEVLTLDGQAASLAFTPATSGPVHVLLIVSEKSTLLLTGNYGIVVTKLIL